MALPFGSATSKRPAPAFCRSIPNGSGMRSPIPMMIRTGLQAQPKKVLPEVGPLPEVVPGLLLRPASRTAPSFAAWLATAAFEPACVGVAANAAGASISDAAAAIMIVFIDFVSFTGHPAALRRKWHRPPLGAGPRLRHSTACLLNAPTVAAWAYGRWRISCANRHECGSESQTWIIKLTLRPNEYICRFVDICLFDFCYCAVTLCVDELPFK